MRLKYFYSLVLVCLIISHSSKAQDYQLPSAQSQGSNGSNIFLQSIFQQGIGNYLKDTFNMPTYLQDFLPNNFFHFIELLHHGNKTNKNKAYFKSVLRLFTNKLKGAAYINAYAFSDLLERLPLLLEPQLRINPEQAVTSLKDIIYELQYQQFKANFDLFKTSPETFLEGLAQQIEDAAEMRKLTLMFLEISLGKLIWSPEDNQETWQITKKIARSITELYNQSVIADADDLNGLYITLLERYCLFLDIANTNLDISTFEKIKEDIANSSLNFFELEEQEKYIETKLQRFSRCLMDIEAKARAYAQGILV